MSTTFTHRTATAAVSVTLAMGLTWGAPTAAGAHPGVFDSATCEESLTRVWSWPGSSSDEVRDQVIFSDAYESYLLRQPPCNGEPTGTVTPSYDEDRVGHQRPTSSSP